MYVTLCSVMFLRTESSDYNQIQHALFDHVHGQTLKVIKIKILENAQWAIPLSWALYVHVRLDSLLKL